MFTNPKEYPFLKAFGENIAEISNEFNIQRQMFEINSERNTIDNHGNWWVKDNGFHPDNIGYDIRNGNYSIFTLYKSGYPIKEMDIENAFPMTTSLIKSANKSGARICFSAFFMMSPHTTLNTHTHTRSHLIYHLLLNDLDSNGCEMRCGNESITLIKMGDAALFDYSLPHETINRSNMPRTNLVIDFNHNA